MRVRISEGIELLHSVASIHIRSETIPSELATKYETTVSSALALFG